MADEEEDEDMLMKELEELANDGGNTSVESGMEDTPSNYNELNQRFVEDVKTRARKKVSNQIEEEDVGPDGLRRRRRKAKKEKKKKKKPTEIDARDLMMARAYGGISQTQLERLLAERARKEALRT